MYKLDLEKAEELETKLSSTVGPQKKQGNSRKTSVFIEYAKAFDCGSQQTVKNSEGDGNTRPPYLPSKKPVCRSGSNSQNRTWKNRLVPNWERSCHPAYLTYMQSTSCEMLGWIKLKLESRLPGEISASSDMQITTCYGRKRRGTKEPLEEVKEKSEKLA